MTFLKHKHINIYDINQVLLFFSVIVINIKIFILKLINYIDKGWRNILRNEFEASYFSSLEDFLIKELKGSTVYPPLETVFSAYNLTPISKVKVVIIGQDPYHGAGQANGLCFSVQKEMKHPPSLQNIFKEISKEFSCEYPNSGDLTHWAKQGVLLLNASLTVRKSEANSHSKIGWQTFTDATIKAVSDHCEDVIFLLWGGFAKKKIKLIDKSKHTVLESGHPSPLSANRGYWFGNNHFIKTNELLISKGHQKIEWTKAD